MMKKFAALLLALCLLGSVASAADLTWDAVSETAAQIEGEFKTFDEIAVKIWMPAVLKEAELSEEDRAAGYIGYYMPEDQTAAVAVQYVDMNGMTLEEYEAKLKEDADVSGIETGTVNGLPAVSYDLQGKDTTAIAFTTEKGYILEVSCAPMSDEGFKAVALMIVCSIQSAE